MVRFGVFELDETSGELRRNGSLVHLPPQPFQILTLLVRHAGEVVDRARIRTEVWGGTAVDFDRSLNVAIAQIRSALNDDAESPRFIQTLPRRGYRFLASIDRPEPTPPPRTSRTPVFAALAVLLAGALALAAFREFRRPAAPIRIAVLPFENVALGPADANLSEGMFDDLLTRLGGLQPDRLLVIGRRSVAQWTGRTAPSLREIGDRLDVRYAVEGTVRRTPDGLHVSARLVRTAGETVLWSGTFSPDEDVVSRVSAAVLTTLFPGASPRTQPAACDQGRDAFLTGRLLANRGNRADLQRAADFFRQAPCAPARAALAEILVRLARIETAPPDQWEAARAAAISALHDDSTLAPAHLALGDVAFWHDWSWDAARREFTAALRINPSNPDAHHDLAWLQVALGERAGALAALETAIAIDPLSARTRMDSAWLLLQIGRFDRAAAEARRTLELDPGMLEARSCLSRALLYAGDARAAIAALPPARTAQFAGLAPADAVRRLMQIGVENAREPYERAWRLAWLGSRDEALTALEGAFQQHAMLMPLANVDPAFASIRNDPRFRKIVAAMGLIR